MELSLMSEAQVKAAILRDQETLRRLVTDQRQLEKKLWTAVNAFSQLQQTMSAGANSQVPPGPFFRAELPSATGLAAKKLAFITTNRASSSPFISPSRGASVSPEISTSIACPPGLHTGPAPATDPAKHFPVDQNDSSSLVRRSVPTPGQNTNLPLQQRQKQPQQRKEQQHGRMQQLSSASQRLS
ncbi:unnamed protein product [Protopolystoma xenopodis]|uniref:Uncharacterized protein n=1 Tax=Protopolystoma xenopodis TaxID=117903 RepID=A0A3S5A2Z8_9PLAT|nr:unnamed protein product [Protopolystoma xenopodis]